MYSGRSDVEVFEIYGQPVTLAVRAIGRDGLDKRLDNIHFGDLSRNIAWVDDAIATGSSTNAVSSVTICVCLLFNLRIVIGGVSASIRWLITAMDRMHYFELAK